MRFGRFFLILSAGLATLNVILYCFWLSRKLSGEWG